MSNVTRWLRWYELAGDALLGEVALRPASLDELRQLFGTDPVDPMFDCFAVESRHVRSLEALTGTAIELARFTYFLEAEAYDSRVDSLMTATLVRVLPDCCRDLAPVRVGRVAASTGTPDRYAIVKDESERGILRVDLYAFDASASPFEQVLIWHGNLVVGFEYHVYAVSIADCSVVTVELGLGFGYFGHLYPTPDYLLIASGERLFRMEPDRAILWRTDVLAADGVLVHNCGPPVIVGEAEQDPPGGWAPFAVSAADGHLISKGGQASQ